jgi:hypothetical protein
VTHDDREQARPDWRGILPGETRYGHQGYMVARKFDGNAAGLEVVDVWHGPPNV